MQRIGIVNRGEPAVRFLNAIAELGPAGPSAVALFVDGDEASLAVRRAPAAVRIGADRKAFLDPNAVISGLRAGGCDAAWLGWGFASEDGTFAQALEDAGFILLAPRPETMWALGDKIRAKQVAEQHGVPVAPWAIVDTLEEARNSAERIGFPLLVKAASGGGGRGIRPVASLDQLEAAIESARDEATRSFAGAGLLLERLVVGVRHVEVQVLGDGAGEVRTYGVRDCSLQRRRQKIIEECPSPGLSPTAIATLEAAARRLCEAVRYRSAGTVEFLYNPAEDKAFFLEVNTRLQVEHPVTEAVFGLDLVRAQIALAQGLGLPPPASPRGWAIEARVTAEDTQQGFTPAPGRLARVVWPTGPGIRVDAGFAQGEVLSAEFDPLVAKIIAHGDTRATALARLARAVEQTRLVVEGGQTNLAFLRWLLDQPAVQSGDVDVALVERLRPEAPPGAAAALIAAAIDRFRERGDTATAGSDRHRVEVGSERALRVYRTGRGCYRFVSDEGAFTARFREEGRHQLHLSVDAPGDRPGEPASAWRVERVPGDVTYTVDGVSHRIARAAAGTVTAPSRAVVLAIHIQPGELVTSGQTLVVLESMKMEVRVDAPMAGRVRDVEARVGDQVQPEQTLVVLEPAAEASGAPSTNTRVSLPWSKVPPSPERASIRLTGAVVGWDIEPGRFEADLARLDGPGCLKLLSAFADIAELFEGRQEGFAGEVSPRRLLETLRSQGPDALSPRLRTRLRRALDHHDLTDLTPTPVLADALMRIQRAGANRSSTIRAAVAALKAVGPVPRPLLDRLVSLDPDRFGPVCEAASRVRYEQYERPEYARLVGQAEQDAQRLLASLRTDQPDHAALSRASLAVLADIAPAAAAGWDRAAEAIARRLEGEPHTLVRFEAGGLPAFRISAGARGSLRTSPDSAPALAPPGARLAPSVVVCTCAPDMAPSVLADLRSEPAFERLTLVVPGAGSIHALAAELELGGRQPFSELCLVVPGRPLQVLRLKSDGRPFERLPDVLPVEERRFELHRLRAFHLRRLPADDEVLLLWAEARDNPDDKRLLAFGEVRSLSTQRGRRLHLPHVDRTFHAAVRAIEAAREIHDPQRTLLWNRITLVVTPVVPWSTEVIRRYITPLAPAGEIGLEKVVLRARFADPGVLEGVGPPTELSIHQGSAGRLELDLHTHTGDLEPRTVYESRVVAARRRGHAHPYEIVALLERGGPLWPGHFEEWDVDDSGHAHPVPGRPPGQNRAGVVFGLIHSTRPPRGETLTRVLLLSDPTRDMGALAEPECRRVLAAIDLAQQHTCPVEWVAVSAGARIDWHSGTENLDWTARVLRRIITFTQAGGEIDVIVPGVCVGAQAYWNAEATMMMHCKGLLIMTDRGSMVLTGKRALDASGGVSAEDDLALGGFGAIMGPNGEAQAHAPDLLSALRLLYRYRALTAPGPGHRRPPVEPTRDRADRDIGLSPYPSELGHGFGTVGQLFTDNPGRKKPFAVRPVLAALADRGQKPVERWTTWHEAQMVIVQETRIGGFACCLVGIDNQPQTREHAPPGGAATLTGGTLYPHASRKLARALNAASGRRPVIILANLAGFDGSPESLLHQQLEHGAEIGRAVVNFDGPIFLVVLSRYHGGAYVVFSKTLHPQLEVIALEGSYASVIGGVPAATVVFAHEVRREVAKRGEAQRAQIIAELAAKFDGIHTVARAQEVGSIDAILPHTRLRAHLISRLAADYAGG